MPRQRSYVKGFVLQACHEAIVLFTVNINGKAFSQMPLEHKTLALSFMAYANAVLAEMNAYHGGIVQSMALNQNLPGIKEKLESGEMPIQPMNHETVLKHVQELATEGFPELNITVRCGLLQDRVRD